MTRILVNQASQNPVPLMAILFGVSAGPLFWIAQMMAGFAVSDLLCYRSGEPAFAPPTGAVTTALYAIDICALTGALVGGFVSFACWRALSHRPADEPANISRERFLAIWGLFSSMWFFCAIVFSSIGSAMVPLCLG
jgi:hypothetical protein